MNGYTKKSDYNDISTPPPSTPTKSRALKETCAERVVPGHECTLGKKSLIDTFTILQILGEGSFSKVVLAEKNGKKSAIKILKQTVGEDKERKLSEVRLLQKAASPHVVHLEDAWTQNNILFVQLEFCNTLNTLIEEVYFKEKTGFSKEMVFKIIREVAEGLLSIHKGGVVHLDVKPSNIFYKKINEDFEKSIDFAKMNLQSNPSVNYTPKKLIFKIGDLNISQAEGLIEQDGDKKYMAPETLQGVCNYKSDVYSLGLIYLELRSGIVLPDSGEEWLELRNNNFKRIFFDQNEKDFLFKMLDKDFTNRPKMENVVKWFTECV